MNHVDANPEPSTHPWEELSALIEHGSHSAIEDFVNLLPAEDMPRAVSRLAESEQAQLLEALTPETGARVLDDVPEIQASDILEHLSPTTAAILSRTGSFSSWARALDRRVIARVRATARHTAGV